LTSHHKHDPNINTILRRWGVKAKVIGVTPDLEKHDGVVEATRGEEIKAWLDKHPEITEFVILDDRGDMAPYKEHLVRTKYDKGLTKKKMRKALAVLKVLEVPKGS